MPLGTISGQHEVIKNGTTCTNRTTQSNIDLNEVDQVVQSLILDSISLNKVAQQRSASQFLAVARNLASYNQDKTLALLKLRYAPYLIVSIYRGFVKTFYKAVADLPIDYIDFHNIKDIPYGLSTRNMREPTIQFILNLKLATLGNAMSDDDYVACIEFILMDCPSLAERNGLLTDGIDVNELIVLRGNISRDIEGLDQSKLPEEFLRFQEAILAGLKYFEELQLG